MSVGHFETSEGKPEGAWARGASAQFASTYALCLAAVTVAVALVWGAFNQPQLGIDDAYIFFVYGRNLANGHGFVYNVGGEAVEGFTSFLWTLICALAFRVTSKPLELLLAINIALVALSATVVVLTVRAVATTHRWRTWIAAVFGVAMLSEFSYLTWSTITLMDTALWSTQLTLLTALTCLGDPGSRRRWAGVALLTPLLVLTRPEAVFWAPLFIAILTFRAARRTTVRIALSAAVVPLGLFALTLGGLTAFRLAYFGYPLPNTFYAKMSPALGYSLVQGVRYVTGYVASGLLPFLVSVSVGLGLVHLATRERRLHMVGAPLVLPAVAGLALPILTGGDHFGGFRFYQNALPILLLGMAFTIMWVLPQFLTMQADLAASRPRAVLVLAVVGLALVTVRAVQLRRLAQDSELVSDFVVEQTGRDSGVILKRLFAGLPMLPTIGVTGAGGIKFEYDGEVIDLLGLNNLHIAHNDGRRIGIKNHAAFEKNNLYELHPDIVVPLVVDPASWEYSRSNVHDSFENKALRRIFDDAAFTALYRYCLLTERDRGLQPGVVAWVHQRRLSEFRGLPGLEIHEFADQPPSARAGSSPP